MKILLNEKNASVYEARIYALLAANRMLIEMLSDVQGVLSLADPRQRLKFDQIQVLLDHLSKEPDSRVTGCAMAFFGL